MQQEQNVQFYAIYLNSNTPPKKQISGAINLIVGRTKTDKQAP